MSDAEKGQNMVKNIFTGVKAFGRGKLILQSIGGIFIGGIIVLVGYIFSNFNYTKTTEGEVIANDCATGSSDLPNRDVNPTCRYKIVYKVDGKKHTIYPTSYTMYDVGTILKVDYDPDIPSDAIIANDNRNKIVLIVILFGSLLIFYFIVQLYYTIVSDEYVIGESIEQSIGNTLGSVGLSRYNNAPYI